MRNYTAPLMLIALVIGFLFGTWLATKVGCAPAKVGAVPAEPNMMTVSLVHRFRHQNKG